MDFGDPSFRDMLSNGSFSTCRGIPWEEGSLFYPPEAWKEKIILLKVERNYMLEWN